MFFNGILKNIYVVIKNKLNNVGATLSSRKEDENLNFKEQNSSIQSVSVSYVFD